LFSSHSLCPASGKPFSRDSVQLLGNAFAASTAALLLSFTILFGMQHNARPAGQPAYASIVAAAHFAPRDSVLGMVDNVEQHAEGLVHWWNNSYTGLGKVMTLPPLEAMRHDQAAALDRTPAWQSLKESMHLPEEALDFSEVGMSSQELMARWEPYIKEASKRFALPVDWIKAVMKVESGGRTLLGGRPIESAAGALGVMQVMPDTYEMMRAKYNLGPDMSNPHDNIIAGAAYLRELHKRYGYPNMFAAYNAGPGRLQDHLSSHRPLPEETQAYICNVTKLAGKPMSKVVEKRTASNAPAHHRVHMEYAANTK
jgi:membrane-bound lytic murein transglycosylase B